MTEYPTRIEEFDLGRWGQMKFRQWLFNGTPLTFKESDVDAISQLVKPGDLAVDIGAYTGDTCIPMALAAGPSGKVLAFEPGPASFVYLVDNVRQLNKLNHVDAFPMAVTARAGSYTFHYVDDGFINGGYSTNLSGGLEVCGNKHPHKVCSVSLTEFLETYYEEWLPKWSYLKIDTEGYDRFILYANAELIRKYKPAIEVEVYPFLNESERKDLQDSIRYIGYSWECQDSDFFLPSPIVQNVLCRPR